MCTVLKQTFKHHHYCHITVCILVLELSKKQKVQDKLFTMKFIILVTGYRLNITTVVYAR